MALARGEGQPGNELREVPTQFLLCCPPSERKKRSLVRPQKLGPIRCRLLESISGPHADYRVSVAERGHKLGNAVRMAANAGENVGHATQ